MSIKKCFSNLSNGAIKQMFDEKLATGMTEENAAAETLKEYNDALQKKVIDFKTSLGIEAGNPTALASVEEFLNQPEQSTQIETPAAATTEKAKADVEVNEDDISFTHKLPNGKFVNSYKDALNNTEEGDDIQIGMVVAGEFFPLINTKKNTNKNTEQGYINSMISSGYLAEAKINSKGQYVYEAAGTSDMYKAMTAAVINDDVRAYLGMDGVKKDGFTFTFSKNKGTVKVSTPEGTVEQVDEAEIERMSFPELQSKYGRDNAVNLIAQREWAASRQAYRDEKPNITNPGPTMTDEDLQLRLLNLLNKMGVKTMAISEYVRKYKTKNGVNPGAKALADIANQVVAYTEGRVEDLAEETAHFINEALPQDQVENVLRNIHRTQEWAEFSEVYREIYRSEYPADKLEEAVRREVLGKIVAKVLTKEAQVAQTETQRNIFERVRDAINNFFSKISQSFKADYKTELDAYLNEVEKLLTQEDISSIANIDNFKHNTFRFYSLQGADPNSSTEKLRRRALALISQLRDTEKQYAKTGSGRRSNLRQLDNIQKELETSEQLGSISSLVSMLNTNVRALEAAVKDSEAKNKSYYLTDEESILYQFVKGVGEKSVGEIKQLLITEQELNPSEEQSWQPIINELTATAQKINELKSKVEIIDSNNVRKLVNDMMDKHSIPEQDRELVTKWIDRAQADTNLFHSTFGQLVHAKDGLLNLGGNIIRKMHNEAQVDMYAASKKYLDTLRDLGVNTQDISKMFVDGQYILSETDFNEFQKDVDNIFIDTYREATGQSIKALKAEKAKLESGPREAREEAILEKVNSRLEAYESYQTMDNAAMSKLKRESKLHSMTLAEETKRKNLERPLMANITERVMKDSYYDSYQQVMEAAGIDQNSNTRQELSNLMGDIGNLRKKAYRKEGDKIILDYNSLSETDRIFLSSLQARRKYMKSYINEFGDLKRGLVYKVVNGETVRDPETGQPVVEIDPELKGDLSEEARIAIDMNNLDRELRKTKGASAKAAAGDQLFYDTISRIDAEEGRESALRFLELNSYMTFTQDFWEGLGSDVNIVDRLQAVKKDNPDTEDEVNILINNITQLGFTMKNILKVFNKKGNPAETDVDAMSSDVKARVRDLQEQLKLEIRKARGVLNQYEAVEEEVEGQEEDNSPIGGSDINEAYRTALEGDNLLESESDLGTSFNLEKARNEAMYAEDHMSGSARTELQAIITRLDSFIGSGLGNVTPAIKRILDNIGKAPEDLQDVDVHADVIRIATRERLAPYYKRFTSKAYTDFYENLKSTKDLAGALKGQLAEDAMVEINPNTSFFDSQSNDDLNPNYDQNFEGGLLQPKKGKYTNKKFSELFGSISEVNGVKTPSNNANLYKAYEATLEYNRQTLEAMNVGENHNKFLLPQIRKTFTQKFSTIFKGSVTDNIRNFTKDTLNYTEDEMIQGDEFYGNDVKIIPKMYIRPLENPEDVSQDLFFSLALRAKEGYMRKSKVKHYGDLMSVHDKILSREMNGKDALASNTYKMFKSALDYSLFGVKETTTYPIQTPFGTFDMTKLARMLLNFVKFRNLGLNIVIPITSYLTGGVTRRMEGFVGEFVDTRSQKLGGKEYLKIATDGMKEIGVVNTRAKINVLGQFFKAFDMNESYRNSSYGWLLRNFPRSGMMLHSAANFPLYGKTLLGILHDFRVVNGEVMNKTRFMRISKADNVTKESLEEKWKSFEGNVIYNYIKHDGNQVSYDREAMAKDLLKDGKPLDAAALEAQIEEIHNSIQGNVQYVNSIIDGQIPEDDRVYAQRHYLLSYFMTHRGWLSIAVARKFKNRHLNLDTGIVEEGSYRSLWGYVNDYAKEWEGFPQMVGNFKKAWDAGDDVQRRNIKRVGVELGSLATLMMLGLMLRAAAEDDENEDVFALQLSNYLMFRTLNELSSVQFNIATNFSDTIESPFVGWTTIKNLKNVGDVFSGEEVKYGSYRGMSERQKYFTKMVPGMKQIFDLQNMNQTYDTYKFYNESNFSLTPVNLLYLDRLVKDAEEKK